MYMYSSLFGVPIIGGSTVFHPRQFSKYWCVKNLHNEVHSIILHSTLYVLYSECVLLEVLLYYFTLISFLSVVKITHVDFHLSVEAVVEEEVVSHANSVRLHWVTLSIVVVTYVSCIISRGWSLG